MYKAIISWVFLLLLVCIACGPVFAQTPLSGDYDGDGTTDIAVWRPSSGVWWILTSSSNFTAPFSVGWGLSGDVPVPGDYDGDGRTDLAVWRPSSGVWWILTSSSNFTAPFSVGWGLSGDVPVPGDYDGDGRTDLAVWRPSSGVWWILTSSSNFTAPFSVGWGLSGDVPVPGDYDGDGRTDLAVWRPSSGVWWILTSSSNFTAPFSVGWGLSGDVPVPGDYDGDGRTDLAVWRPSSGVWWILTSSSNFTAPFSVGWGLSGDVPVPGDYDGDGRTDLAVWRPSSGVWWILTSSSNFTAFFTIGWGVPGDVPVVDQLTILRQVGLLPDLVMKTARVSGVTGQWGGVSFGQTFTNPIVIAGPLSNFDNQPAGVRVRNVTATGFEVQAQEWDAQDGVHGAEQLSCAVVERGRRVLSNGKVVLAESTSVTGGGFQTTTFSQPFTTAPIILATVVTQNEVSAVAVQIRNITTTSFQIRLREQEANPQAHVAETVHYLAWEPGSGTVNGLTYEVGTHGVGDAFTNRWFATAFAGTPVFPLFLSAAQTTVEVEAYTIRLRTVTRGRVDERLREDDSFDTESIHAAETVGYLVLGTPGPPGVGKDAVFVSMGDSITFGVGDDVPSDNFQDGPLPAAGYPPISTNTFASQRGKNVLIINEGIPGDRSTDGLGDVASIVNAYSLANYFLLLYGANDVLFNVPSGQGLLPGQPGYLGSFKGNLQQIIDAIIGAGKIPVLAKVLYQSNPSVDAAIQQYNQVINELVVANSLPVIPPDFYTFFKTNPSLLPDGLHPNGVGYQSMSSLWYNSLVNVVFP